MAVVPTVCYARRLNDSINPTPIVFRLNKLGHDVCECDLVSKNNHKQRWEIPSSTAAGRPRKSRRSELLRALLESDGKYVWECSSTNEKQLRSLGSYFARLKGGGNKRKLNSLEKIEVLHTPQFTAKKELQLLDAYFRKVGKDKDLHNHTLSAFDEQHEDKLFFTSHTFEDHEGKTPIRHDGLNDTLRRTILKTAQLQEDEISDLYLISSLVSLNIAVFLFEIASPVKNSELQLFSLPSLYGAKINDLILVGEWWRLVTPMFLHSGVVHVGLSCWALLTFGRQVCREYGPFTFFLIYVLGGVSGNFASFLHTPEPTVGGTGPVFAMIGAWLSYQFQNKGVIAKDVLDNMFFKAIIAAVISSILSSIGPIDEWTHTGAAFSGMVYGILTSPIVEVDDATSSSSSSSSSSSRRGQQEEIKLVRKYADPCKSFAIFALFILVSFSLPSLFNLLPPHSH